LLILLVFLVVLYRMTSVKKHTPLGNGIYTMPDLALILGLSQPKVRRWMNEYWNTEFLDKKGKKYSTGEGQSKVTDFKTLIEFFVFYQLREMNIGVKKIFDAHARISSQLKTQYPFASVEILANKKDIFYSLSEEASVNANKTQQIGFKVLIESFCKKIEFSNDKIAERFYPLGKEKSVVVDPSHQFGQPTINGTNILAETIYSMYQSGEKQEIIGILYDLTSKQIDDAIAFHKQKAA